MCSKLRECFSQGFKSISPKGVEALGHWQQEASGLFQLIGLDFLSTVRRLACFSFSMTR